MNVAISRRTVPPAVRELLSGGIDPVLARLYAARGVATQRELECGLASLPPFASMRNIESAASRLARAIERAERIVIVADYDADGATACAVGVRGLRAMGATVDYLVPNRFEYGYGLTPEIVELARTKSPHLIVTVDNGIASYEGVAAAAAAGIDVLVTDHHLPGDRLPAPAIIVNPNQPACAFPSKNLAGVGVMFYVLAALRAHLRGQRRLGDDAPNLASLLDLVALGTVADVVRLDHANRILVEQGLRRMRARKASPGVLALFEVARRDVREATATDLGFVAGPRLNAAGRLSDMSIGIRCLLETDGDAALQLAAELDRLNRERRDVESTMQDEALASLDSLDVDADDAYTLCLFQPTWHQGVVGIVASRLKDRFHRATIVFARGSMGELKGSGRSIDGFHLRDALDLVSKREPGLIRRFGGHAHAAGLSIDATALDRFSRAFEAVARQTLSAADLSRVVESDGALAPGELCADLAHRLREPVWGQGFPAPTFDDVFDVLSCRVVAEAHTRLVLARGDERFGAVAFRTTCEFPARIHAVFRVEIDRYNGEETLQLVLQHWQPA